MTAKVSSQLPKSSQDIDGFQPARRLDRLQIETHYTSSRANLIDSFYRPCIQNSVAYDRATGSFSTGIMVLVQRSVAEFAKAGGKIRLVCSHELTQADIESIDKGYNWRESIERSIVESIQIGLYKPQERLIFDFVASLIAIEALDIHIAFKPGARGIFHEKMGVFHDETGNAITFIGSINESWMAWDPSGNYETFEVFSTWGSDRERAKRHIDDFERLWTNREPTLDVIPFPEIAKEKLKIKNATTDPMVAYENFERGTIGAASKKRNEPLKHQLDALEAWERSGRKGILDHATGSGKTFTAILAIEKWINKTGPVLILVPSRLLLDQWYEEIRSAFDNPQVIPVRVGGGHSGWRNTGIVESLTADDPGNKSVIIATVQTARGEEFRNRVRSGPHLLIVWDEVHWAGAKSNSEVLEIDAGGRLGLSATPQRYGDSEGTNKIMDYFGNVVHKFSLKEAISAGRLCQYNYYGHVVPLDDTEMDQWRELTIKINRAFARVPRGQDNKPVTSRSIELLIFQRSRVIKNAEAKISLAGDILLENYRMGDRWLVYCEDREQLRQVVDEIQSRGLSCDQYYSYMESDRGATLNKFVRLGGILVAIRCLDEGVDIPALTHAIILASSKNPREFIQRRGRVLRTSPGKYLAQIHDAIVMPTVSGNESEKTRERNIVRVELARALKFAADSSNPSKTFHLKGIASDFDIFDLDEVSELDSSEQESLDGDES